MSISRFQWRPALAMAHDALWVALLWAGLTALQDSIPVDAIDPYAWRTLPLVVAIHVACFMGFGLYRGIWRYASLHDLRRIAISVGFAAMVVPNVILLTGQGPAIRPSIYFLHPLLTILAMAGGRIFYRWWKELPLTGTRNRGQPVLLLSSGNAPISTVSRFGESSNWRLVGILDEQRGSRGRAIAGVRVLGQWNNLPEVARRLDVGHAILSDDRIGHAKRRQAFELCERAGVKLLLLPAVDDLLSGRVRVSKVRDVELDDLLGRDPVDLDVSGLGAMLTGKVVMVTGAGGSIGSELCMQIADFKPAMLILYELNEFGLYNIEQKLQIEHPDLTVRCLVGDVKDSKRLDQALTRFRPTVIFHAAAYKHVPLMERDNAWSAVRNNVLGTLRVAEAAARHPVERFVFVSTDKAINPTSVMGATKRLGEILVQLRAQRSPLPAVIVRFGNVLGSAGSVVPKFRAQIAAGGPVTVTHPNVTRYFMSIREASQLVLQSALMGRAGETLVLDMGEPVPIVNLARDLISLSGFTEEEIRIEFTGLRPGEKLYEELLSDSESTLPTRHPKIRVARATRLPGADWEREVLEWLMAEEPLDDTSVREALLRFIPEYQPYGEAATPPANVIEFPTSRSA